MREDLKIVVCHHKETRYLQQYKDHSSRYIHIHGGRALHKAQTSMQDFFDEMLGDDTGDNISVKNPEVNEFTALYWAWKHYDEIGNPTKVGLNHYNRAFTEEDVLQSNGKDLCVYENILPILGKKTMMEQFLMWHSSDITKQLFQFLKNESGDRDGIEQGFYLREFYPKNMFIMSKDLFFEYMTFMDRYLKICLSIFKINDEMTFTQKRTSGFVLERISSIFFSTKMKLVSSYQFKIPKNYI